jgi:predicted Zn finger-like uncharacterized protein
MTPKSLHITCPSCRAIFKVDASSLGNKETQKVRCAICRHTWIEQLTPLPQPDGTRKRKIKTRQITIQEQPSYFPNIAADEVLTPSEKDIFDTTTLRVPHKKLKLFLRLFGFPLLVLIALGVGLWISRDKITEHFPEAQDLYSVLGISLSNQNDGFILENQTTVWRETDNGEIKLIIAASLKNQKQFTRITPSIRVRLLNSKGELKKAWFIQAPSETIDASEIIQISTDLINPPNDTTFIKLEIIPAS